VGSAIVRTRLLDLLIAHSYRYDPSAPFRLASGRQSAFYVDCRATTMRGEAMDLVGGLVAEQLPADVQAVGGLTMGADPIAVAVASHATRRGRPLDAFSVRKEPKGHGLRRFIEGGVEPGARVAVVDDVVTTGGSTIDAIRRCREEGLEIRAVVVLVDRQEEGGLDAVRREAGPGVPVVAIFTRDELQAHWARAREGAAGTRSATR
jgi:orotate phosphoribosyltransferase